MKIKSKLFIRQKPINWNDRGLDSWISDIETKCRAVSNNALSNYTHLIEAYNEPGRIYFSLAARSRARSCPPEEKAKITNQLFLARTLIETSMIEAISLNLVPFFDLIFKKGFFGYSIKQGVSVRFPLSTCKPTKRCGGGCYAHDGRDKYLASIARGVFNYLAFQYFEKAIVSKVSSPHLHAFYIQIDKAINYAKNEANDAQLNGFTRRPRIRLSHVGELAAKPEVTNWLAKQISERSSGEVDTIIYTRHPNASRLDTETMVVNFTVESDLDARKKYAPSGSHLVASSWGGHAYESVSVNFLEHHGRTNFRMTGDGLVCPVTVNHELTPTCDSAKCSICFSIRR